jgi:hypothetical protein
LWMKEEETSKEVALEQVSTDDPEKPKLEPG